MDVLTPPMGVAYLASYMIREGVDVQVIDGQGEDPNGVSIFYKNTTIRGLSFDAILERIDPNASLIGISNLFTVGYPVVRELSKCLKVNYPNIPIVLGGNHPTNMPEKSLADSKADYVILGEGEQALARLCKFLEKKDILEEIDGIAYIEGDKFICRSAKRILNLNEDSVPFPARHLLPLDKYIEAQSSHSASRKRWTPMITSRGCPFSCTFCSSRNSKFIARSAIDIVNEIEECIEKFGIEDFHFEDDNLTLQKPRIIEICNEIIKRGLKIDWQTPNGIRSNTVTEELLEKMQESGCVSIVLAPESGSKRVLKEIAQKGKMDHDHIVNLTRKAHQIGLKTTAFFIIGFPGEKVEEIKMTIDYACKLAKAGLDEALFSIFIPLPATPLWDVVKTEFKDEEVDFLEFLSQTNLGKVRSWSKDISDNKLALLRSAGYKKFLLTRIVYHPLTFVKSVLNILRGVAETKAETHIRTLLKKNIGSGSDSEINVRLHPLQVIYVMLFKIIPVILFNKKESQ